MFRTQSLPFTHDHSTGDIIAPPPSSISSPSTQMPTVFVHPPEEEQDESQPWCAFDASKENTISRAAFTTPEMDVLVSKLEIWSQTVHPTAEPAPTLYRTQTDSDVFISRQDSLCPSLSGSGSIPLGLASIPESPKRQKERDDDDDIVEVMKVRRSEGMHDVSHAHGNVPMFKKPKSLRSRAVQALRSIKNVRKVPRRPALEHAFPAKENDVHTAKTSAPTHAQAWAEKHAKVLPTQPSTPLLKRRTSQPLSNLFSLGHGPLPFASSAPDAVDPTPSSSGHFRTLPHSRSMSTPLFASTSASALHLPTDGPARPTSPSFSIRGTRNKFSFVNLQTIFSGNASVPHEPRREPEPEPGALATTTDVETNHPDPALPRTVQTPVEDGWDSEEDYDSPRRHALGRTMRRPADESPTLEQEFSFEMRLNSLHFDSFSFDADAF